MRGALYTVGRNGDAMRLEGASRGHATIQEKGGQAGMATVEGGLGTAGLFDRWQLSRKAWSEPVAEGVETREPVGAMSRGQSRRDVTSNERKGGQRRLGGSQTSGPSPRVTDLEEECFSRVHFVKTIT